LPMVGSEELTVLPDLMLTDINVWQPQIAETAN